MLCRYCERDVKLIKAHVIPEGFFRRLREGSTPPVVVRQRAHVQRAPIGIYDRNILCRDCDAIFSPWDDYAQAVLSDELQGATEVTDGVRLGGWYLPRYDYKLLKLFFISLLWRASVSTHPFFHRIRLGPLEFRAKEMISVANPGTAEEFGVVLARFEDKLGSALLDPHPDRLDGIKYCRFYLGRYVAYVKVEARPPSKEWRVFTMRPDQPLSILARNMKRSKELQVMRQILAKSMRGKRRDG